MQSPVTVSACSQYGSTEVFPAFLAATSTSLHPSQQRSLIDISYVLYFDDSHTSSRPHDSQPPFRRLRGRHQARSNLNGVSRLPGYLAIFPDLPILMRSGQNDNDQRSISRLLEPAERFQDATSTRTSLKFKLSCSAPGECSSAVEQDLTNAHGFFNMIRSLILRPAFAVSLLLSIDPGKNVLRLPYSPS